MSSGEGALESESTPPANRLQSRNRLHDSSSPQVQVDPVDAHLRNIRERPDYPSYIQKGTVVVSQHYLEDDSGRERRMAA
ncbi:MAG: hypothetical protein HY814_01995, partial [Candidatus Riflebacteria bacterium]|nr:hypothetical protein [Candidatus Riflebacteria bacterium]